MAESFERGSSFLVTVVDLDGFEKSKVRTDYKVERVPTVYLIDPEGKVLITNPSLEEIESRVK